MSANLTSKIKPIVLLAAVLTLASCEVILWQEPSAEETSLLRKPEWNPEFSQITLPSGTETITVTGTARPSGLSRYENSTPGDWATLKDALVRWEDGALVQTRFSFSPDTSLDIWPQRYITTLEIPLRTGNTWFETAVEDTWGYSSPWKKTFLIVAPVP